MPSRPTAVRPSTAARIRRLALALISLSAGVTLFLRAELGVAPFDVLNTGLSDRIGVPFALAYLLGCIVLFGLGSALGSRPGWASVAGVLVISALLQLFLAAVPDLDALPLRWALFVLAFPLVTAGICMVIATELGPGPIEVVMLGLARHGVPITRSRWIAEGSILLTGALIGGAVGVGTVIFTIAIGPLVALGLRLLDYAPS